MAQGQDDAQILQACEKLLVDYKAAQAQLAAQAKLTKAQADEIAALTVKTQNLEALAAEWKDAALKRKQALGVDDELIRKYDESITDLKVQLARVIGERDGANAAKKWWGFGGFVVGVALTVAVLEGN